MFKKELTKRVRQAFAEAKTSSGSLPLDEQEPMRKHHEDTEKVILQIIKDMPSPTLSYHVRKAGVA